jgi:hypothetical protein
MGLVSAQGANATIWANDMKLFHGLLYARSKGEAEALVLVGVHLALRALTPSPDPHSRLAPCASRSLVPQAEKFGYTAVGICAP